jgi:DNA polymerase I-like protein with 3'-5' exonuclease and polymerase domains
MGDSKKMRSPTGRLQTQVPEMWRPPPRLESTRELVRAMQPPMGAYFPIPADYTILELRILAAIPGGWKTPDPPPDSNQ